MANCADNSYVIYYTDMDKGTIQIQKSALIFDELDIALIGKTRLEYGEIFNENVLHLLENFACPEQSGNPGVPNYSKALGTLLENPTEGQVWYNKTQKRLHVWDGNVWKNISSLNDVAGNSGVIEHGQTLPMPISSDGYTFSINECTWTVSPFNLPVSIDFMHCFTDPVAVVTMQYRYEGDTGLNNGYANYQIIGIRGNENIGEIDCQSAAAPTSTPVVSPTPTPTLTASASVTPTITPTMTVTPTPTLTPTPSEEVLVTPTMTVTPTPSEEVLVTPTPSPTVTVTPTLTPSATVLVAPELLEAPEDLGWTPPINVYRSSSGTYSTDYDATPLLNESDVDVTTYYVDGDSGNDANPGTESLPKKTLYAVTNGRVDKLLIKARGTFYRNTSTYIQTGHDCLQVEAWDGDPCIFTTETDPAYPFVWTSEGSGTWSSPFPAGGINVGNVVYFGTDVETLEMLTVVTDLSTCLATPGSQFTDWANSKTVVHTTSGSSPATDHTIYGTASSTQSVEVSGSAFDQRILFYGISFRGGNASMHIHGTSVYEKQIDLVNCSFMHATNFAALHATGSSTVIAYNCIAGPSRFDGFSASTASGAADGSAVPYLIEISCIGRNNGAESTGANQGSTTHFGGKVLRVNGQYYNNADDQIADVGLDSGSWNLGCAFGPKRTVGFSGVQAGNDVNATKIWLDGCSFSDVTYQVGSLPSSSIFYRNMTISDIKPGSGSVGSY